MTYREWMEQNHPENVGKQFPGGAKDCPWYYGLESRTHSWCHTGTRIIRCDECWDREMPEEESDPLISATVNQTAKADYGKEQLCLVPRRIVHDIATIRMYGNRKYGDPENWRTVEVERYRDAAYRHWLAYLDDPHGVDKESGLPHLWHFACNVAFLCEMEDPYLTPAAQQENSK